ncbi:hypothetical protein QCD58_004599 [Enterobacter hormaechei]|nr:hypothetical protein [Enterobacter hormaechei]
MKVFIEKTIAALKALIEYCPVWGGVAKIPDISHINNSSLQEQTVSD